MRVLNNTLILKQLVHNFLGLHRFDANFQIQVGSWAADKSTYANGNVLVWKASLPFSNLQTGQIPADNMGKTGIQV